MIPNRFAATLVDFLAYSLRMRSDNGVGHVVISLSGRVDESRLKRTIRLAMDAEPILGCQFVDHWFRPYWRRRTDLDELSLCPVVKGDEHSPAFSRFLAESIDPARDPLCQAMIFRGATDTICVKVSHAVMDGPGMARYTPFLIDVYRRLKEEPSFAPTPNVEGIRHLRDFARQFSFRQRLQLLRELAASRSVPDATWVFPEYRGEDAFRGYVMLKLPPERVRPLSRYGRDRRATMTSVMLAGLYLAALKVFRTATDEVVTFSTTADLRRFLRMGPQDFAFSNMSGPGRFQMDPRRDRGFETALESIREQLKRIVKDPTRISSVMALLIAFPPLRWCFRLLPLSLLGYVIGREVRRASSRPERRWTMVNVGQIVPELLDFEEVSVKDAYFVGPLCIGPGIGLVFSIFRHKLTLSVGLSGRVMDESVARQFLKQVDRELPFHSSGPGSLVTLAAESPSMEESPLTTGGS